MHLVEVKGVTLEDDGAARFPDAPTERGVKHLRELQHAVEQGLDATLFFCGTNGRYLLSVAK